MKLKFAFVAGALAAGLMTIPAQAQDYPSGDIRLICTFPAGSGADTLVRFFAEQLRQVVGDRAVIVENRTGAASAVGIQHVANQPPDGLTLLLDAGTSVAAYMSRFETPAVDVAAELDAVATINRQAFMVVVADDSPHESLEDLTAYLREAGEDASFGTSATSGIVMGELYKALVDLETVQVRYDAGPNILPDLAAGLIDFATLDPVLSLAQQREGNLRILGVSSGERIEAMADIPTLAEAGVDMDLTIWWSVLVPEGTPEPVQEQINTWFAEILAQDNTREFLASNGGEPFISTVAEANALFEDAIPQWEQYLELAGIPRLN